MGKFPLHKVERLVSPERAKELDPEEQLKLAGLTVGDVMADIGCGPGFFTVPAARLVGEEGKVYALDTEQEMLDMLSERVKEGNVEARKCGENDLPVEEGELDFALAAFVLHEAEDKPAFLTEIRRALIPGGRLLIIDWVKKDEERGPPLEERLSVEEVYDLLRDTGFVGIKSEEITPSFYRITAAGA